MMKIPNSLRYIYDTQREAYERLLLRVDEVIFNHKDRRWHYVSRIKTLESFGLKLETGRYDPDNIDDFFACTIVVENLVSISKAEALVRGKFEFHERRPPTDSSTSKPPDSFRFDDTRLYVRWKDSPNVPATGLNGLLFEVQIKTFLAHAWSIATHDLIYKTDQKSWAKERIAFQIKAMLEHAETSIQEAQTLANALSLNKTDDLSDRISAIIKLLNKLWPPDLLPQDKKRLAENIDNLIRGVKIDLESLHKILRRETRHGRGTKTRNLSPYLSIVQSLLNQELNKMSSYLTSGSHKFKVFVPMELELPPSLQSIDLRNAIVM